MKRVIYFIESNIPTVDEMAEIEKLNAAAEAPYAVIVANAAHPAIYGETQRLIPSDFVAGKPPAAYADVATIDPNELPGTITEDQAVVTDGDTLSLPNNNHATAAVSNGKVTLSLPDTSFIVSNGGFNPIKGLDGPVITYEVSGGGLQLSLDGSHGVVGNLQELDVGTGKVKFDVTDNKVTGTYTANPTS